jgi:short-subunit dehydrogenase
MRDIRGSRAIVTGASRGVGTYIAKTLAAQGVSLALAARDAAKLEDTRGACEALGARAIAVPTDVTSREDLRRLVETVERELGPIDILVNNAGIEITKSLQGTSFDEIDAVVCTNLSAPVWLIKMVLPQMVERRRGAIVNVSSLAGKTCAPYNAIYSATKAGLIALSLSVDLELDGTGVTIGTVCPGFVSETGMWANTGEKAPRMLREVSPQRCANAVLKVIAGSSSQELVSSSPIRPLLALAELAPGLYKPILKRLGVLKAFRDRATKLASVTPVSGANGASPKREASRART